MRALTIRQPWADAIAHGSKRVENRTWPVPGKHHGARILIHAGAAYDPIGRFAITDPDALDLWPDKRGALLAIAMLTGCHQAKRGCCPTWGERNVWHWQLADVRPLAEPIPCKGALGLWRPAPELLTTLPRED